jgi:prefoldin beta subunit
MDPNILHSDIESEVKELQTLQREMQKHIETRQRLIEQQSECELVKREIDILEPEAKIYKLEGPLMVSQTLNESKANVKSRLEKISNNLSVIELNIKDN